ncbi:MAG: carboxypeptidase-like regulatory domain-containing protein [Planctomycetota bacterium]
MQRSTAILLVVAAAGAVFAAFAWRGGADGGLRPGDEGPPPAVAPQPVAGPQEPTPVPAGAPRVVVRVTEREVFAAPLPPRLTAVQLPDRTALPLAVLAGTGANPWAAEDRAGVALVEVEAAGVRLVRQVGLEVGLPSELRFAGELQVHGRVVGPGGKPVAGAAVWLGTREADGSLREATTGDDGAFEATVPASTGVPLVVRKTGFASAWRVVAVDVDDAREFEIALEEGGSLAVQIAAQAERVELGAAYVAPGDARGSAVLRFPFFLQCLLGGVALDQNGRAEIQGLPQHGEVAVTIFHPLVPIGVHAMCKLDGAHTTCLVPLRFLPARAGVVVDDDGNPLGDAALLWRPQGRSLPAIAGLRLLPPELAAAGCCFARTGADGAFVLPAAAAGDLVAVRAAGHAGRDDVAAAVERIALPAWRGGEPSLRVAPPRGDSAWRAEFDLGDGLALSCKAGEPAVVSTPHAGRYDVVLTTFVGDEKRGERAVTGVAVTGPVDVAPPAADPKR